MESFDPKTKILVSVEDWLAEKKRVENIIWHPALIELICAHVANGGTVLDMARDLGIRYSMIMNWIRADVQRSDLYNQALKDRGEHVIETVLHILKTVSTFDIRTLYSEDGSLLPIKEWPPEASMSVSSIKETDNGRELKMSERLKAIELVGKNKGLFIDKTVHEAGDSLSDLIVKAHEEGNRRYAEREAQRVQSVDGTPKEIGPGEQQSR